MSYRPGMGPKEKDRGSGAGTTSSEHLSPVSESFEKWHRWLIAAITKIKNQKQRPNLERITQTVRQQHSVSPEEVLTNLQVQVRDAIS